MLKTALVGPWCGTTCSTESHRSTLSVSGSGSPTGSFTRQVGISHTDTFAPNDDEREGFTAPEIVTLATSKTVDEPKQGLVANSEGNDDVISQHKTVDKPEQESEANSGGIDDVTREQKAVIELNQESAINFVDTNDVIRRQKKRDVIFFRIPKSDSYK